jgi:hypothetical protein
MRFVYFAEALCFIASLASAALIERQSAAQVAKLPGWVETMAVRQNGNLLLNRLDTPELWTLDPSTKQASKLLSFTGALGLTGIAELSPDVFVVVTGDFNTKSFALGSGSYAVYKVDLTGSTPKSTLVKKVPESGFFIGVAPFNNDTIFIADASKGALYQMTISTGEYAIAMQDAKMKAPSSAAIQEGIHGVKYHDGYVYFTNTFGNTFNKIKVDTATGKTTGSIIPINTSLQGPEDFTISSDGTAYIATLNGGAIFKVTADGKATQFAAAAQCSSCAFGRTDKDKSTLYISTSQGAVLSAPVS